MTYEGTAHNTPEDMARWRAEFQPKQTVGYTKAEAVARRKTLVWCLAMVLGAAAWFGVGWGFSREFAYHQLPDCQEDEVLYPADDYTGPGDNAFRDYQCVHIDVFDPTK